MGVVDELAADLAQRGADYGSFENNSKVFVQVRESVMDALKENRRYNLLDFPQRAAIDHGVSMIATKLSRIATGDPAHHDSWKDIAGYAHIVDRALNAKKEEQKNV